MFGSQLKRAVQLLHHAAKAHDGTETHFTVDPHQFPKIAEECEMGVGRLIVQSDGLLAKALSLFEVGQAGSAFLSYTAEMAFLHPLSDERLNGLGLCHTGPSACEGQKKYGKDSSVHDQSPKYQRCTPV